MSESSSARDGEVAREVTQVKMLIGGQWRAGRTEFEVIDPYRHVVVARAPESTLEDLNDALNAAVAARPTIAAMPAYERAALLRRVGQLRGERAERTAGALARKHLSHELWSSLDYAQERIYVSAASEKASAPPSAEEGAGHANSRSVDESREICTPTRHRRDNPLECHGEVLRTVAHATPLFHRGDRGCRNYFTLE